MTNKSFGITVEEKQKANTAKLIASYIPKVKIFGKHARTLCCSNLPFEIRHTTLENFFGE